MSTYRAPLSEMKFVLTELAGLDQVASLPGFEGGGRRTSSLRSSRSGEVRDRSPRTAQQRRRPRGLAALEDGTVRTPAGFKDAYLEVLRERLERPHEEDRVRRQGLPHLVGTAVEEMWHSSNLAFNLCPLLTQGAIEGDRAARHAGAEGHVSARRWSPARGPGTMN
jgi:hypothetical protein